MDWLEGYLDFTAKMASPRPFHLWSGIAALAGTLERKIWLPCLVDPATDRGKLNVYPGQIMVVLVGASAVVKKTAAADQAMRMLRHLEPWQFFLLPKKTSPQQLLNSLERLDDEKMPECYPEWHPANAKAKPGVRTRLNSAGFIYAPELGAFFSTEAFAETLATHINDLNDCPPGKIRFKFRTWESKLWQPCVTLLGCITPTGIATELPRAARTAGYFGRILWVFQETTDRMQSLRAPSPSTVPGVQAALVRDLREIGNMWGPIQPSARFDAWFNGWFNDVHFPWLQRMQVSDGQKTGYWGRKDTHVLKVATVMMASDPASRKDRVLKRRHGERALKELEQIERFFPHAMAELGVSPWSDYEERVLERLESWSMGGTSPKQWISDQKLRRALRRYGNERRHIDAVSTLRGAGEIETRRWDGGLEVRRVLSVGRMLRSAEEEPGRSTDD